MRPGITGAGALWCDPYDGTMYRPGTTPSLALKGEYIPGRHALPQGDGGSAQRCAGKDLMAPSWWRRSQRHHGPQAAQDALRESEEKLRNIVENSTNVFYSHTPEGRLTYLSPQFEKIFGYSPREGKLLWMDTLTDNPANQRAIEATRQAILTGKPQPTYEMELKTGSGGTIWVEVNESPVVRDGKTVMIVGALQDITERKRAEKQRMEMESASSRPRSSRAWASWQADRPRLQQSAHRNSGQPGPRTHEASGSPGSRAFIEQARTATMRASELTGQMLAYTGKEGSTSRLST